MSSLSSKFQGCAVTVITAQMTGLSTFVSEIHSIKKLDTQYLTVSQTVLVAISKMHLMFNSVVVSLVNRSLIVRLGLSENN
jgi:hypothetical protein